MGEMEKQIEMMKAENQQLRREVGNIHATVSAVVSEMNMKIQDNSIHHATATLRVRKDVQKHQTELNTLKEEVVTDQAQLMKVRENTQTIQNSLTQYAIAIDEVRQRQDVLDIKTTNGIFVWKIPDIRKRYRAVMERPTISLYSPPFYSCLQGHYLEHGAAYLHFPPFYIYQSQWLLCLYS